VIAVHAKSFFEDVSHFERRDFTEVFATIGHTVGPNQGPTPQQICLEAEPLAMQLCLSYPASNSLTAASRINRLSIFPEAIRGRGLSL
jgi:hypothetical protein